MSRGKLILSIYSFFSLVWFGLDRFYIYKFLVRFLSFFLFFSLHTLSSLSFPILSPAPSRSDFFPILLRIFSFLYSGRFTQNSLSRFQVPTHLPTYPQKTKSLFIFYPFSVSNFLLSSFAPLPPLFRDHPYPSHVSRC